jgi:hypothetical protein
MVLVDRRQPGTESLEDGIAEPGRVSVLVIVLTLK